MWNDVCMARDLLQQCSGPHQRFCVAVLTSSLKRATFTALRLFYTKFAPENHPGALTLTPKVKSRRQLLFLVKCFSHWDVCQFLTHRDHSKSVVWLSTTFPSRHVTRDVIVWRHHVYARLLGGERWNEAGFPFHQNVLDPSSKRIVSSTKTCFNSNGDAPILLMCLWGMVTQTLCFHFSFLKRRSDPPQNWMKHTKTEWKKGWKQSEFCKFSNNF